MATPNRLELTDSRITIVDADGNGYFDPPSHCVEGAVPVLWKIANTEGNPIVRDAARAALEKLSAKS